MTARQKPEEEAGQVLRRRGNRRAFLAGAVGAAVGATATTLVPGSNAKAATGEALLIGQANETDPGDHTALSGAVTEAAILYVRNDSEGAGLNGESEMGPGVEGQSGIGPGVLGKSRFEGPGVLGESEGGPGVTGDSFIGPGVFGKSRLEGPGVKGESDNGPGVAGDSFVGPGVFGKSRLEGPGVLGESDNGPGVMGDSFVGPGVSGRSRLDAPGVLGESDMSPGVEGRSESGPGLRGESFLGPGVLGQSPAEGPGVKGQSETGPGVEGQSQVMFGLLGESDRHIGVMGRTDNGLAGVVGTAPNDKPGVAAVSQPTGAPVADGGVALAVVGRAQFSTAGSGLVHARQDAAPVADPAVTRQSHIMVTFTADPGRASVAWVERQPGDGFVVHLSRRPRVGLPFTYLIVEPVPSPF